MRTRLPGLVHFVQHKYDISNVYGPESSVKLQCHSQRILPTLLGVISNNIPVLFHLNLHLQSAVGNLLPPILQRASCHIATRYMPRICYIHNYVFNVNRFQQRVIFLYCCRKFLCSSLCTNTSNYALLHRIS